MGEHGPLADTGGAAGVLQRGNRIGFDALPVGLDCGWCGLHRRQRLAQAHHRHLDRRHRRQHLAPDLLHPAHNQIRHGRKHFRYASQHHMLDASMWQHFGQLVGEQVHHDQHLGTRVTQLMHHLADRVQRVGVDQHTTGLEHTERNHRVRQAVGQLHRHAVPGLQLAGRAQIDGKGVRELADLAVGERPVHAIGDHAGKGLALSIAFAGRVNHLGEVAKTRCRQDRGNVAVVGGQPGFAVVGCRMRGHLWFSLCW